MYIIILYYYMLQIRVTSDLINLLLMDILIIFEMDLMTFLLKFIDAFF